MNYYYIDYMIKQRQLAEIEECERRRLLLTAGVGESRYMDKLMKGLVEFVRGVRGRLGAGRKELPIPSPFITPALGKPGKGVER